MEAKVNAQESLGTEKPFNFNLTWKKGNVISVEPNASLRDVVQLMKENHIGDVLVISSKSAQKQEIQGIVTDRDIALCLTDQGHIEDLTVADIMSEAVVTASEGDDFFKLVSLMNQSGVTRLPMLDAQGKVIGVVTAKNLLQLLAKSLFEVTQISEQQQENERIHQH